MTDNLESAGEKASETEAPVRVRRWQDVLAFALLAVALYGFFYIGAYRALPCNTRLAEHTKQANGDADTSILLVYDAAKENYTTPLWGGLDDFLVWRGHNPGFYYLAAILMMKAGLQDLFAMQFVTLTLNIAALVLFFWLIRALFKNPWIALFSVVYIAFCPVFINYATALHAEGYMPFLFMASAVAYLYALRRSSIGLFVVCLVFYYLLCWNHWFGFIIPPLYFAGIHYAVTGRILTRKLVILALAPVLALTCFLAAYCIHQGGVAAAVKDLYGVASFRLLDTTQPGGYFNEQFTSGEFVNYKSMGRYLSTISYRIERWYYLPPKYLALMLAFALIFHPVSRSHAYRIFVFWLPAAFFWHSFMFQVVLIHDYSALYHYQFLSLVFGCFIVETARFVYLKLEGRPFRRLAAVLAVCPAVLPVVIGILNNVVPTHGTHVLTYKAQQMALQEAAQPLASPAQSPAQPLASPAQSPAQPLAAPTQKPASRAAVPAQKRTPLKAKKAKTEIAPVQVEGEL